ncbi:MAG TPA: polysaccharide biosynthesis tyrosine autokinase [Pseudolabrys sp.]|nr:polysaccharide biosynthesis tyrosine autokinase [Pseudolabrys sp.]
MLHSSFDYDPRRLPVIAEAPPVGPADDVNRTNDLREIIHIFRRRRWIIIGVTAAFVGATAAYVALTSPLYTATSTVFIDPHRSNVADTNNNQPQSSNFNSDSAMVDSQAQLIQSPTVLRRVVDKLHLVDDPEFVPPPGMFDWVSRGLSWVKNIVTDIVGKQKPVRSAQEIANATAIDNLQHQIKVTREGPTSFLVDIAASSQSPEKAARIANAVVDAYFYEAVYSKQNTNKLAASWFNAQLAELKSRVQAADKTVEEFRATHGLITTQGQTVNDQQLTDLNNSLIQAHVETAEARAKYDQVEDIIKNHRDPGALAQALTSPVMAQLRTQYAQIAKDAAELSSKFGSQHPRVLAAKAQLRDVQRLINQELHRILDSTRNAYQVAQSREQALRASLDRLQSTSGDLNKAQIRLRALQREADADHTLYESFLARYKQTRAEESLELPDARVVSRADVPIRPSFPKTTLFLAVAALMGLGLGAVLAFFVDMLDGRIKTPRQAEETTDLPTLAAIPLVGTRELARRAYRGREVLDEYNANAPALLPALMQPPLMRYALEEPTSLFAEAVRAVRLATQRATRDAQAKVVIVTSSIDGEGKTTLATNLALSLANIGMRTIIVDGDLRNPELTRSLCPQAKLGTAEVAAGLLNLEQVMLVDEATELAVLPSPPRHKPQIINELVFSGAMHNLLDSLRARFDYVIVDAPPVMPLVDARALAEQADRVVFAVRWDATPREVVSQALEALAPVADRLLGTVLTRVDLRRLRFYDYYRSSSYMQPYSYLGRPRVESVP